MITKFNPANAPRHGKHVSTVIRTNMHRQTVMVVSQPYNPRRPRQKYQRANYVSGVVGWDDLSQQGRNIWTALARHQTGFPADVPYVVTTIPRRYFFQVSQFYTQTGRTFQGDIATGGYADVRVTLSMRISPLNGRLECLVSGDDASIGYTARVEIALADQNVGIVWYNKTKFIGYLIRSNTMWRDIEDEVMSVFGDVPRSGQLVYARYYCVHAYKFTRGPESISEIIIQ